MSDLIKREDAIKALYKYSFVSKDVIEREINAIPSVDIPHSDDWEKYSDKLWKNAYERGKADRPQGEWIIHYRDKWMVRAECPKCHRRFEFSPRAIWKCCPMCETRMKGADDETAND